VPSTWFVAATISAGSAGSAGRAPATHEEALKVMFRTISAMKSPNWEIEKITSFPS